MVRGARRMGGRRLIIINALIAQDFAPFTRGWNTTHVIYNHMQHAQVEGSRSTALHVACAWSWHAHAEIAWPPAGRKAWCESAHSRTELVLCGGAPVRCPW